MESALSGHIHIVYDVPRDPAVHRASPWHPSSPYSGSQAGQDCTRVFIFTLRGQLQGGREERQGGVFTVSVEQGDMQAAPGPQCPPPVAVVDPA